MLETTLFDVGWRQFFWGREHDKLLKVEVKYDPDMLMKCCKYVGLEESDMRDHATCFPLSGQAAEGCRSSSVEFRKRRHRVAGTAWGPGIEMPRMCARSLSASLWTFEPTHISGRMFCARTWRRAVLAYNKSSPVGGEVRERGQVGYQAINAVRLPL